MAMGSAGLRAIGDWVLHFAKTPETLEAFIYGRSPAYGTHQEKKFIETSLNLMDNKPQKLLPDRMPG
jgi:hypothetical protein